MNNANWSNFYPWCELHPNKTNKSHCDSPFARSPTLRDPQHESGTCWFVLCEARRLPCNNSSAMTIDMFIFLRRQCLHNDACVNAHLLQDNTSVMTTLSTTNWTQSFAFRMKWCSNVRMLHHFIYHSLIVDCCIAPPWILPARRSPQQR